MWSVLSKRTVVNAVCEKYCDTEGEGNPNGAFSFIMSNEGIITESNYPFVGSEGTCNTYASPSAATISGYQDVPSNSESALLNAVANQPVSVAISGDGLQSYKEVVFSGPCGPNLNHAVTVVGYNTTSDGTDYWIVPETLPEEVLLKMSAPPKSDVPLITPDELA
ncbi:Cysteine endopeptidase RepA-like protein [Drosera capensis]